jgi:DNA polymerase-4
VAHCDIDAFYASVELLRRPELIGKPLVVAGSGPRSVVTTASYEARKFGIDSAMPAARARALCPHAVFVAPDHTAYREKSVEVWTLVRERVERVQQVGIDEAYLDVTEFEKPMRVLRELVAEIAERTGMVMSVGVGPSKLVAKTVSGSFKPRAFKALSREDACRIFAGESTRLLQGIGPKTADGWRPSAPGPSASCSSSTRRRSAGTSAPTGGRSSRPAPGFTTARPSPRPGRPSHARTRRRSRRTSRTTPSSRRSWPR